MILLGDDLDAIDALEAFREIVAPEVEDDLTRPEPSKGGDVVHGLRGEPEKGLSVPITGSAAKVGTIVTPRVADVTMPITPRSAAIFE